MKILNNIPPVFTSKPFRLSVIALSLVALAGCDEDDIKRGVLEGVWQSDAYGLVMEVDEDSYQFYQYTSNYCQEFELGIVNYREMVDGITFQEGLKEIENTVGGLKVPGLMMERKQALPDHCRFNLISQEGDDGYTFDPQLSFDIFWETFNELYAFFHLEEVNWDDVYTQAQSYVTAETSEEELFEILSATVEPLKDFHVQLEYGDEGFAINRKPSFDEILEEEFLTQNNITPPLTTDQQNQFVVYYQAEIGKFLQTVVNHIDGGDDGLHRDQGDNIYWGKLNNNLGYLNITTMSSSDIGGQDSIDENLDILSDLLDQILTALEGVDGFIVDVRFNGGGDDRVSQAIVARMLERELHAYSKQARLGSERTPLQEVTIKPSGDVGFTGPVVVLTSATTFSAAEIFSMAMRERPNTTLIGEATGGGLSDTLPKTLPFGMDYTLSNEFYITPRGDEFEGVGVPVEIEQPFFTKEQRDDGVDLGLEAAIDFLTR